MTTFDLNDTVAAEKTLQGLVLLVEQHIAIGKAAVGSFGQVIYDPAAVREHTDYTKLIAYIKYLDEDIYNKVNATMSRLIGRC